MGPISNIPALVQVMAWHWPGAEPLSEPMIVDCFTRHQWVNQTNIDSLSVRYSRIWILVQSFESKWYKKCLPRKLIWKYLPNIGHFVRLQCIQPHTTLCLTNLKLHFCLEDANTNVVQCCCYISCGVNLSLIARFMGPIWGQQDPGGPHVGPMNFAIWNTVLQIEKMLSCMKISEWWNNFSSVFY